MFQHILTYVRRRVFPLFYDEAKGFDHLLYLAVLGEARYFQIRKLQEWIEKKRYEEAVKVKYTTEMWEEYPRSFVTAPNMTFERFDMSPINVRTYICHRGIPGHRGNYDKCNWDCGRSGASNGTFEEVPSLQVFVMKKQVIFNVTVCAADV